MTANATLTSADEAYATTRFLLILLITAVGTPLVIIILLLAGRIWNREQKLIRKKQLSRHASRSGVQQRFKLQARLQSWLYVGPDASWGLRWDLFQALLATASCVMYILGTYATVDECSPIPADVEFSFEIIATLFFILDYVLNLFLAQDRILWVLSPVALAELLTILPIVLLVVMNALGAELGAVAACSSSSFAFMRFLRLARFLRIVRLSRFMSTQDHDSFWHQCSVLLLSLFSIVLVAACTFQWAETISGDYELPFHEALYFMVIEVLGRPRVPMHTLQGYLICTCLVVFVVLIVPWRLVLLAEALKRQSIYTRQMYTPSTSHGHVIVAGEVTIESVFEFTADFFHEDAGDHDTRVLLLSPREPSNRMRTLLNHPAYAQRLIYVQGSIDMQADLERCRADVADAAFLLADKMPMREPAQHRHDLKAIANVLSLKSFNRNLQLFVQLLRPENKAFMAAMPDWRSAADAGQRADQVFCVSELASSLLGLCAIAPGASTLCTNLCSTHRRPAHIEEKWLEEYSLGSCNEIYLCSLEPGFLGWTVEAIVLHLFDRYNATLLALEGESGGLLFCPLGPEVVLDTHHTLGHIVTSSAFVAAEITAEAHTRQPKATSPETDAASSGQPEGGNAQRRWRGVNFRRRLAGVRLEGRGRGLKMSKAVSGNAAGVVSASSASSPQGAGDGGSSSGGVSEGEVEIDNMRLSTASNTSDADGRLSGASADGLSSEGDDDSFKMAIHTDEEEEAGEEEEEEQQQAGEGEGADGAPGQAAGGSATSSAPADEPPPPRNNALALASMAFAPAAPAADAAPAQESAAPSTVDAPAAGERTVIDPKARAEVARTVQGLAMEFALDGLSPAELVRRVEASVSAAVGHLPPAGAPTAGALTAGAPTAGGGAGTSVLARANAAPAAPGKGRKPLTIEVVASPPPAAAVIKPPRVTFAQVAELTKRRGLLAGPVDDTRGGETLEKALWARLVSPTSAPTWKPRKGHVLLCGGVMHMGVCARVLVEHWPKTHITALCQVPAKGATSFAEWLEKAVTLLSCPPTRVTIVYGSDLRDEDLLFAGAARASSVLIFSPAVQPEERQNADIATVLTAMRVQRVAPEVFSCVDLHEATNARFFRLALKDLAIHSDIHGEDAETHGAGAPSPGLGHLSPLVSPGFTKGMRIARSASTRRRVMSGAVTAHPEEMSRQLSGVVSMSAAASLDPYMNRMVACGRAFSTVVLDRLLCRAYFNNHVVKVLERLASPPPMGTTGGGDKGGTEAAINVLRLKRVPSTLHGKTYGHLLRALLRQRQQLALGLFRRRRDGLEQLVEYVIGNPPKETVLIEGDRVYILGAAQ